PRPAPHSASRLRFRSACRFRRADLGHDDECQRPEQRGDDSATHDRGLRPVSSWRLGRWHHARSGRWARQRVGMARGILLALWFDPALTTYSVVVTSGGRGLAGSGVLSRDFLTHWYDTVFPVPLYTNETTRQNKPLGKRREECCNRSFRSWTCTPSFAPVRELCALSTAFPTRSIKVKRSQ